MRPFLQRVFVVLWLLWGLILGGLFFAHGERLPFADLMKLGFSVGAGTAIPVVLLQYLILGFFNPLRLLEAKSPPA